jgi:capsular exopolysaccharide synthesis family protein
MEDQLQPGNSEQSTFNIKDLFYKYVRFLPLFIISIALALFVAYVFLRYATLVFTATGSLVVQDEKNTGGGNDKIDVLFQADTKKNIQNEIEYLQSRQMMSRVVNALNLNFTYLAKGNIKELNVYKSSPFTVEAFEIYDSSGFTLKIAFDNEHNFRVNESQQPFTFGQVFKNEYGVFRLKRNEHGTIGNEYKVAWHPTSSVASDLISNLTVLPKQNTGILVLKLESTNPQLAADVINQLMAEYQQATIDDKNATTQQRLFFIDKELDTTSHSVDSITNIRQNFLKRNQLFDPQTQSASYLSQIEKTTEQEKIQRTQLNNVYLIEGYIKTKTNDIPVPSSLGLEDPTLNQMVTAYNQVQLERKTLLRTAPPGNIAVRQRDEIIDRLQKNILASLQNIKGAYNSAIGSLQSTTSGAQAQLQLMPGLQQQLTEIDRLLEGKLDIYKSLLEKREETAIQLASTISNIKVLQDATLNNNPIKPNRRSVQLMAALIGLLIPAIFIFVLELLNDKVSTRADVERLTNAAVIGEVGHSYSNNTLVVTSNNRGVVAEQFRIVRSNLQYVLNHINKPVILVTSSFSGEGKSFASTNVGAVMALAGKRTIILEFDIRKPKILSQLHIPKKAGLTNYLLGKIGVEELPIPVEGYEKLFVLACGPVPPNPAELLLDPKLDELFTWLRANFDVVIVDTAPVGMVSDAMTLSKYADSTLYIVRQGHTFKRQISLIDEFHRDGKLPKISIILNDVKIRTGYGYYGYGRYGYGHGYGSSYYEEEAPPPTMLQKWFGWLDITKWKLKKKKKKK